MGSEGLMPMCWPHARTGRLGNQHTAATARPLTSTLIGHLSSIQWCNGNRAGLVHGLGTGARSVTGWEVNASYRANSTSPEPCMKTWPGLLVLVCGLFLIFLQPSNSFLVVLEGSSKMAFLSLRMLSKSPLAGHPMRRNSHFALRSSPLLTAMRMLSTQSTNPSHAVPMEEVKSTGAFMTAWPVVHTGPTHFKRAWRQTKAITLNKTIKNVRNAQRAHSAQWIDALMKVPPSLSPFAPFSR